MKPELNPEVTVIAVHGAWADGSSWNKVTAKLLQHGLKVVAAQIPLTSFDGDVAVVRQLLKAHGGPVVLAGHSYGAAVITAAGAGAANVKSLVYVAGIVPGEGEAVGQILMRAVPHAAAPRLNPDADGLLWVSAADFANAIAPDASAEEQALMAATQKPIAAACLCVALGRPAWSEKPSWFLIAENDRMLAPETQRFTAERAGSQVLALAVDHMPLASAASSVANLIIEAARA